MNEYFLYHLVATGRVALAHALQREIPEQAKDSAAPHAVLPAPPRR